MRRVALPVIRFSRILAVTLIYTWATALHIGRSRADTRPVARAERQREGCRRLCRILNLHVDVEGEVNRERPALIVSNHFGILDPLAIAAVLPVAFVGKAELRRWPIVGWVCATFGVLFVHRGDVRRTHQFVDTVQEHLRHGVHVLAFPEGTTTRETVPRRFKTGAFAAVAESEFDVVPAYLSVDSVDGRRATDELRQRVVWADSTDPFFQHFLSLLAIGSLRMTLRIGDPIRANGRDRRELARLAREAVVSLGAS